MDLQRELIESSRSKPNRKRWTASAGSLALHGILVGAIVVAGAQTKHSVAAEKRIEAFVTRGAAPPPPPPPPPPPAKSSGASQPRVQSKPVVHVQPQTLRAPVEIPKEIPKIDVPVTPMIETVQTLPEVPESGGVVDTGAGDATNGVTGGVEGGVAGGVVGGEVGGVAGGELGGVKGGELGGVVGGELGGKGTGTEGGGTGGNDAPPEPPPPPPNAPLRVGGDVKAPVVIDRADPLYTETARKARVAGIVIVEAIISKSGRVEDVRVIKGLPMGLSEEAERAVKKWRFKPGTLNGQPVATIFNLTVNFKLD